MISKHKKYLHWTIIMISCVQQVIQLLSRDFYQNSIKNQKNRYSIFTEFNNCGDAKPALSTKNAVFKFHQQVSRQTMVTGKGWVLITRCAPMKILLILTCPFVNKCLVEINISKKRLKCSWCAILLEKPPAKETMRRTESKQEAEIEHISPDRPFIMR